MPVTPEDLKLVHWEASHYGQKAHAGHDDIVSDGMVGLMKGVELWDSRADLRRQFDRSLLVRKVIGRTMIDGLRRRNGRTRDDGRHPKQEFFERMERLDRQLDDGDREGESMLDRFVGEEDEHFVVVVDLLQELPEREREVVWRSVVEGETLSALAAEMGVTESRVSQIRSAALARLRGETVSTPREPQASRQLPMGNLPAREHQILTGMADGLNNDQIAGRLLLGEETVKTYVRRLLKSLGAKNRAHAVAIGFRQGLIA